MGTSQAKESSPRTTEARHYFFLNHYREYAFTRCPNCDAKTKVRKFCLVIHVEPLNLLSPNKTCRYCTNCDLVITKQEELKQLLNAIFMERDPEIVGNEYFVYGTMDLQDWRRG